MVKQELLTVTIGTVSENVVNGPSFWRASISLGWTLLWYCPGLKDLIEMESLNRKIKYKGDEDPENTKLNRVTAPTVLPGKFYGSIQAICKDPHFSQVFRSQDA